MADYVLEKKSDMTAIADAIRSKLESTETMKVTDMPSLIESIETGGGTPTIGNRKIEVGQFTPESAGSYNVPIGVKEGIVYAHIWLSDISVISKYADSTIMVSSERFEFTGGTNAMVRYRSSGTDSVVLKTVFGIIGDAGGGFLRIESHANWTLQPEIYNYMIVYE